MPTRKPYGSTSEDAIDLYRITREDGAAGHTLYVERIWRVRIGVVGVPGVFVRNGRRYQPLHPKAQFKPFLSQHLNAGARVVNADTGSYLDDDAVALPFILDWERPVGGY